MTKVLEAAFWVLGNAGTQEQAVAVARRLVAVDDAETRAALEGDLLRDVSPRLVAAAEAAGVSAFAALDLIAALAEARAELETEVQG